MPNKTVIGLLIFLLVVGGIYIELSGTNLKIYVQKDYSTFYINGKEISGRETNSLFNGTKKLTRDLSNTYVEYSYDNMTNISTIIRGLKFTVHGYSIVEIFKIQANINTIKSRKPHNDKIKNAAGYAFSHTGEG